MATQNGSGSLQLSDCPPVAHATLRAHAFAVTSIDFYSSDSLISGDEGGWCFAWNIMTRRPRQIWKPHSKSIVSVQFLPQQHQSPTGLLVLTHGRDHKLKIFLLTSDQKSANVKLPLQTDSGDDWPSPLLVYEQDVNALNFCAAAFAVTSKTTKSKCLTFVVPSTIASENVDVYQVDREDGNKLTRRAAAIESPTPPNQPLFPDSETSRNAGIVMALLLVDIPNTDSLLVIVGYESGLVAGFKLEGTKPVLIYATKCHSQPILSLDLDATSFAWFMSSSADAKIVQHPLMDLVVGTPDPWGIMPLLSYDTKHSGLASLAVRSDSKIFATAGWDGMIRVFSTRRSTKQSFKCLAVFKGGRQNGVTTVAFSPISEQPTTQTTEEPLSLASKIQARRTGNAHLLAVGGKDGRISLFSLY